MSDRQKLFYALLVSAFLHLAVGLILATWSTQHSSDAPKALPDLTQLTVTIMPPRPAAKPPAPLIAEAPTPIPPNMQRPVLDSDGLTPSSKAPAHPVFQSDANMVAGSRLPATGDLPLPSEAGPSRKFTDFADRSATIGKGRSQLEPVPARHPAPQSMPDQYPNAITKVQHTPEPIADATPTPRPTPTAAPDALALGKPTPTPAPAAQRPTPVEELARLSVAPSMHAHADVAPAPASPPTPPSASLPEPAVQREMEKTRVNGGINAPGPPGVDAIETPFGRYHRKLSNLIGSRWKLYLQEHPKDVGDVTILVKIDTNGKVASTRVLANHALDDLAELSTRAIMESDLPPVPDDLAPMLRNGKLEISFNFNVYDASNDSPGR